MTFSIDLLLNLYQVKNPQIVYKSHFPDPFGIKQPACSPARRFIQNVASDRAGRILQSNHTFPTAHGRVTSPPISSIA